MSRKTPTCSLVTPTYNWPEALELLLLSALNQSWLPNEIIIADDGSRQETKELIDHFKTISPVPIVHIWHEDNKNQKPKIMNKAIAKAKYDYIIEIDGDIIMHKHFVKDHLVMAKKNTFLYGSRVNIKESHLQKLFKKKQISFNFFSKGIKKRGRTLRLPFLSSFYKEQDKRSSKLRGCNMSFWRDDFIKVNGFNENLVGWGIDDSEMIQRLLNIGVKGKRLKFRGIVYHIYHNEQSKDHIHLNKEIEDNTTKNKITHIPFGVQQYL
ncbi:glycosyltransferase family 2 protein [Winogradskyella alexanderae]|uniref:Glycosyltransferase family 2 protein n=1 Tax=Winogradskyella alexanderae TaxID=2877123 RepID=A0ABS7XQ02_9FLAO|nr:glycosyltransferase family 2 protein [Winogradskyella alexanderae]MCA0132094.1 glycosyltransferase family 2 protein [Winogradskyella alexanderae]